MVPQQLRRVVQDDPDREDIEIKEFGEERYCYIQGQRYHVGRVLTFHPHEGDTNADFEARIDRTVQWLYAVRRVVSVSLDFEKQGCLCRMCHDDGSPTDPGTDRAGCTARRWSVRSSGRTGWRAT